MCDPKPIVVEPSSTNMSFVDDLATSEVISPNMIIAEDSLCIMQALIDSGLQKHLISTFGGSKSERAASTTISRIANMLSWTYLQKHNVTLAGDKVTINCGFIYYIGNHMVT